MSNYKIQIKDKDGNLLFPAVRIDNVVDANGSTVSVPVLDGNGKIKPANLPGSIDDVVELFGMYATANRPTTGFAQGAKYFDTTTGKIVTASAANIWGPTSEYMADPIADVLYVDLSPTRLDPPKTPKVYRWNTSSMVEIVPQVDVIQTVAASGGSTVSVPSEAAVRSAITAASQAYILPTASTSTLGGIKADGTVLTVAQSGDTAGELSAVPMTATTFAGVTGTEVNKLVTALKMVDLVNSKLSEYQEGTLSGGTGISVSSNTVSLAQYYDMHYETL